jgi:hypothetical protein
LVEVLQRVDGIFINKKKNALEILERFEIDESKPVHYPIVPGYKLSKNKGGVTIDNTVYKQVVGSLMHLKATRLDVMFAASLISKYITNPTQLYLQATKRVLRHLKGTTDYGVFYKKR